MERIGDLENQVEGLSSVTGHSNAEQKTVTLTECFAHFKANVSCKSERAKTDLVRRVESVLGEIGLNRTHASVTMKMVHDACKTANTANEHRLRDAKRFFTLLSHPAQAGGMRLVNPASAIKPGTPEPGDNEILNPLPLLKHEKLAEYWKALVACLGLAGLRLSEAASLEWKMLDEAAGIVRLRATKHYPALKNNVSERDIKFWKYMTTYKKVARHDELIFDRPISEKATINKKNPTWFEMRDDQPTAVNLPREFIEALKDSTGETYEEPARRLRRFWDTQMESLGFGHLISKTGGHSRETAKKHYHKHAEIIRMAKIGDLPEKDAAK